MTRLPPAARDGAGWPARAALVPLALGAALAAPATGAVAAGKDRTFEFSVADWNRDGRPDLLAIKKSGTGTNSTEVHILS
ncbi:hypothetical protein [Streptomyces sp. NPDC001678]|uniref:hypothetical protein n=1 Tax=Streptomyces sp. NPDC001678 TaxID=3364599 RepID=UPI00369ED88C